MSRCPWPIVGLGESSARNQTIPRLTQLNGSGLCCSLMAQRDEVAKES